MVNLMEKTRKLFRRHKNTARHDPVAFTYKTLVYQARLAIVDFENNRIINTSEQRFGVLINFEKYENAQVYFDCGFDLETQNTPHVEVPEGFDGTYRAALVIEEDGHYAILLVYEFSAREGDCVRLDKTHYDAL